MPTAPRPRHRHQRRFRPPRPSHHRQRSQALRQLHHANIAVEIAAEKQDPHRIRCRSHVTRCHQVIDLPSGNQLGDERPIDPSGSVTKLSVAAGDQVTTWRARARYRRFTDLSSRLRTDGNSALTAAAIRRVYEHGIDVNRKSTPNQTPRAPRTHQTPCPLGARCRLPVRGGRYGKTGDAAAAGIVIDAARTGCVNTLLDEGTSGDITLRGAPSAFTDPALTPNGPSNATPATLIATPKRSFILSFWLSFLTLPMKSTRFFLDEP